MYCNSCGNKTNEGEILCENCAELAKDYSYALCVKCRKISAILTDAEKEENLEFSTSTCRSCDVNEEEVMLLTKSYKKISVK